MMLPCDIYKASPLEMPQSSRLTLCNWFLLPCIIEKKKNAGKCLLSFHNHFAFHPQMEQSLVTHCLLHQRIFKNSVSPQRSQLIKVKWIIPCIDFSRSCNCLMKPELGLATGLLLLTCCNA